MAPVDDPIESVDQFSVVNLTLDLIDHFIIFLQQVVIIFLKNVRQKWVMGRQSIKSTVLIPVGVLGFTALVCVLLQSGMRSTSNYALTPLPPLSASGVFNNTKPQAVYVKNLYYSPNNHSDVTQLMLSLKKRYPDVQLTAFNTQNEILNAFGTKIFQVWCAISFDLSADQYASNSFFPATGPAEAQVTYSIRMNPNIINMPFSTFDEGVYNDYVASADGWLNSGYLTLQNFIRTSVTNMYPQSTDLKVNPQFQRYPSSPIYPNEFVIDFRFVRYFIWKWICPLVWTIAMIMPMLSFLNEVVREKENRIKDLLEISGLMPLSYWVGYEVTIFCYLLITIWLAIGFMYGVGILTSYRLAAYASLSYVYVLSLAAAGMAFGFAVFKSEYYGLPMFLVTIATAVGGLFIAQNGNFSAVQKLAFAFFLPPTGFTMGIFIIENWFFDYPDIPIDKNWSYGGSRNLPSLNDLENTMIGSAIVYMIICYGMPFDWIFRRDATATENLISSSEEMFYPCDRDNSSDALSGPVLLNVSNLSHVYPDGTHAVKNISFQVRTGEILSFLGANGAGKSTTMNMLCGTLKATVGDAIVGSYSISNNTTKARRTLGICTQQDVLWNDLSVTEHLYIFGFLRGTSPFVLMRKVRQMIEDLGFPEKAHFQSGQLSGGQKRRLCAGISMIGENKVVFLDEPTAGLDPVARRQLWELVEKNRAGRAILLTTHFMDEADVLGDRIAIVKDGRLRCLGSSAFLKRTFGIGYLLRCSLIPNADHERCFREVSAHISDASLVSKAGSELSIRISKDHVNLFPTLFERLETNGRSVGFASFGIETTTLEEVFMRIVNEDHNDASSNPVESNRLLGATPDERANYEAMVQQRDAIRYPMDQALIDVALTKGSSATDNCNCLSLYPQVKVMFVKRFRQFTRSKGQFFMGFFIPIGAMCIICFLFYNMPSQLLSAAPPPVELPYLSPMTTIIAAPNEALASSYSSQFSAQVASPYSAPPQFTFVGQNYSSMYKYVNTVASREIGRNSSEAIAYQNLNNYTIMYNASYPINLAGAASALLDVGVANATNNLLSFVEYCQYLPYTSFGAQVNYAYFGALLFGVYCGSFGSALSIVISGERVGGIKHQQLASGASTLAYWLSNLLWDVMIFNAVGILFSIALAVTKPEVWGGPGWGVVFVSGLFFSFASSVRFYCFSYFISDIKMAQTFYFYGSIAIMYVVLTIWGNTIFSGTGGNANITSQLAMAVSAFCTVLEPAFGYFLLIVYQHNFFGIITLSGGANVLSLAIGGSVLIAQVIVFVIFSIALCYIELGGFTPLLGGLFKCCCFPLFMVKSCCVSLSDAMTTRRIDDEIVFGVDNADSYDAVVVTPRIRIPGQVDPDVLAERSRVQAIFEGRKLNSKQHTIFIHELRKVYFARGTVPTKVAVKDVSLCIAKGEIFGLLGANGAGKTTLLKMVSGLEAPTQGTAMIDRFNIVTQKSAAQRSMGLCPQFDTLVERLTVRENLHLFGRIKGVSSSLIYEVVDAMMNVMNIKKYQNKMVMQLSGGNRRKVSLVVALLGAPATAYLDEPSTGLDPVASRLMWRLLKIVAARKEHAVVLTTHNMLECEAVCTRIGIMKSGELVCMGNSQHLRSAYGTGFLLEMTLEDASFILEAKEFVTKTFQNATVVDEHVNMINYEFPVTAISRLSSAFRIMEENKARLHIVDYSLSQSTLEQVFLKQIRPSENDVVTNEDVIEFTKPHFGDYLIFFVALIFSCLIPGTHHWVLRNNWRGTLYFFTFNEVMCGWLLDIFDARVLVQRSVQEHGHIDLSKCCCLSLFGNCSKCCYACWYYLCCCWTCCCCCFRKCCPSPGQNQAAQPVTPNTSLLISTQPSSLDIELGSRGGRHL